MSIEDDIRAVVARAKKRTFRPDILLYVSPEQYEEGSDLRDAFRAYMVPEALLYGDGQGDDQPKHGDGDGDGQEKTKER